MTNYFQTSISPHRKSISDWKSQDEEFLKEKLYQVCLWLELHIISRAHLYSQTQIWTFWALRWITATQELNLLPEKNEGSLIFLIVGQ